MGLNISLNAETQTLTAEVQAGSQPPTWQVTDFGTNPATGSPLTSQPIAMSPAGSQCKLMCQNMVAANTVVSATSTPPATVKESTPAPETGEIELDVVASPDGTFKVAAAARSRGEKAEAPKTE